MAKARARGKQCKPKTSEKRMGPFGKNWSFGDSWLLSILQKSTTSKMHNFFNFELFEVFLDFLEILRCPLSKPFCIISILYSMLKYEAFTKNVFLLTFQNDL